MAVTENPAIIVESIAIEAPIGKVFDALTVPEQLVQWWGSDDSYRVTGGVADVRPGGAWKTTGLSPDGSSFSVSGVYRSLEPPRHVEFTWCHDWSGHDPQETLVRYDLTERDGITTVTVTHSGFTSVDDRDGHERGWKQVLAWLRDFVAKRS